MLITIETQTHKPIEVAWDCFTNPKHIVNWYFASEDWHAPYAENDIRQDGRFKISMAARDNSMAFDFTGQYTEVQQLKKLVYRIDDNRMVETSFNSTENGTRVVQSFETENQHSPELQREGWLSILNNFALYTNNL